VSQASQAAPSTPDRLSGAAPRLVGGPRQEAFLREIYDAFQRGEFNRWDKVFADDMVTNSSGQFGVKGRAAVKEWANQFVTAFAARVDLVDQIDAIDQNGNGRAVITFNLNWHHVKPFFNVQPTGRSGTSVENLIMTVRNWKVVRMEVADTTLDMGLYLHERGWALPQNVRPVPIVKGIERDRVTEVPLHE
jgi:ketosteroid isomerase-like protein